MSNMEEKKKRKKLTIFKSIFDTAESYVKDINDDGILLLLPSVFILIFLAGNIRLFVI